MFHYEVTEDPQDYKPTLTVEVQNTDGTFSEIDICVSDRGGIYLPK
ncbi:MAG: hypothetical protein IJH70_15525 [Oscillospiraceae bacterium]|nr:hypothetical protein [Oscillospiraceae bacterium]